MWLLLGRWAHLLARLLCGCGFSPWPGLRRLLRGKWGACPLPWLAMLSLWRKRRPGEDAARDSRPRPVGLLTSHCGCPALVKVKIGVGLWNWVSKAKKQM